MEKINNNLNLTEELEGILFITDNNDIITKEYKQYKVIAVVSKAELMDAIEKIWENKWIGKYDVVKFTVFKNGINVGSLNPENGLAYKTVSVSSIIVSNPSGENVIFFANTHALKKALNLILNDKIIIRAGSDYILIKSHDLYEKTIAIIRQTTL
jgi:hypothetical protein